MINYTEKLAEMGIAESRVKGLVAAMDLLHKELCKLDLRNLRAFTADKGILGQLDLFARHTGGYNVAVEIHKQSLNTAWSHMDLEEIELIRNKMIKLGVHTTEFAELGLPGAKMFVRSLGTLIRRSFGKTGLGYNNITEQLKTMFGDDRGYAQDLSIKLTDKYVGSCSHLDDWDSIGNVTIITTKERGESNMDGGEDLMFVYINSDSTVELIKKALKETFTSIGCSCEHDCCGCQSTRISRLKDLGDGFWCMKRSFSYNY